MVMKPLLPHDIDHQFYEPSSCNENLLSEHHTPTCAHAPPQNPLISTTPPLRSHIVRRRTRWSAAKKSTGKPNLAISFRAEEHTLYTNLFEIILSYLPADEMRLLRVDHASQEEDSPVVLAMDTVLNNTRLWTDVYMNALQCTGRISSDLMHVKRGDVRRSIGQDLSPMDVHFTSYPLLFELRLASHLGIVFKPWDCETSLLFPSSVALISDIEFLSSLRWYNIYHKDPNTFALPCLIPLAEDSELLPNCNTCPPGSPMSASSSESSAEGHDLVSVEDICGQDVLDALVAQYFVDETNVYELTSCGEIDYGGYHPFQYQDEIHTSFRDQYIFSHTEKECNSDSARTHRELCSYVEKGKLWYVLLHGRNPRDPNHAWDATSEKNVMLFALGKSPASNCFVGVTTSLSCHGLCY